MLTRIAKIAMVAAIGVLMTLVAFDNVTDPKINFGFVQHVLSMDTLLPTTTISYRAITNPTLHDAAFALIVAAEAATAVLCWAGTAVLVRRLHADAKGFKRAKTTSVAGLTLGFLLYQFGFITIGGEWFGMWMSHDWNGQESAFRFAMILIAVLVFLVMPDNDPDQALDRL